MDVVTGVVSTLVPVLVFVSASEGDDPDGVFSSTTCSTSFSNEGEESLERMGEVEAEAEADMEVERRKAHSG